MLTSMTLSFTPKSVLRSLLTVIGLVVALHIVVVWLAISQVVPVKEGVRALFDLDKEQNIPTLLSTLQLTLVSILSTVLRREARLNGRRELFFWTGLACVFAVFAIDEFCMLHEHLQGVGNRMLGGGSMLKVDWIVPYCLVGAFTAAMLLRSWWQIDSPARWQIFLAGCVLVSGGILAEVGGSYLAHYHGWESFWYQAEVVVEESLEMVGAALAIHAMVSLLAERGIRISFGDR